MSEYSSHISEFIEITLLPKIDSLNFQLNSYEEFGYNSDRMIRTTLELSRLVVIYDFLIEYVNGSEECDWPTLRDMITATGLSVNNTSSLYRAFYPWAPSTGPGEPGGTRILVKLVYTADGADETILDIEGNYVLTVDNTASWVPSGAEVNDILFYSNGAWTIAYKAQEMLPGSIEILFDTVAGAPTDRAGSNYVWDGVKWEGFDAYEPNEGLGSVTVSNPNLGDISDPPYSIPAYTGDTLRGRSISAILDDIIFETVPYMYTNPSLHLVANSGNFERGASLAGTIIGTYTKRDGGNLNNQDSTFVTPGADEMEITLSMSGTANTITSNTHAEGNRSISADIPGDVDIRIPSIASSSIVGDIELIARTADGVEQSDNKGNPSPRPSGVLRRVMVARANYYSRYPIWIGATTERFTVSNPELSDLTVNPNEGSNTSGTLLDSNWLQGAGSSMKSLFTSNISNFVIDVSAGDVHMLVVCPPGITISAIQMLVMGSWVDVSNLAVFSLDNVLSLNGDEPKTYKTYYLRDIANGIYPTNVKYKITTTGTIQP